MERSIFLVEDDAAVRTLLAGHLRKQGHRVLESANAENAVRHLVQEPPFDLLITDVHLPTLSGIDLLHILQAHSPMKPVLVITGDSDDALAREAIRRGAAGYLLKPFQLFELDAAVRQALGHLELLETTGIADRQASPTGEFGVPVEWTAVADARCSAGPGHGQRVERLATVLAKRAGLEGLSELATAARLHEIGWLIATGEPDESVPALSAQILERTAVPAGARTLIEVMGDRDGAADTSGGVQLAATLAIADRIDHRAVELVREGEFPPTAIMHALEEVAGEAERSLGSEAGAVVSDSREVLSAIWILSRGGYPAAPPPRRGGDAADAATMAP